MKKPKQSFIKPSPKMLNKKLSITCIAGILFLVMQINLSAQSLIHPHILIKDKDKAAMLKKINNNKWAGNIYKSCIDRVNKQKNSYQKNPETLLSEIPAMPGNKNGHNKYLTLGAESAMLYWLTDDEGYAQLAADIMAHYIKMIGNIKGKNINFHIGTSDAYLIDTRYAYPKLPVMYDFIYPFLKKKNTWVNVAGGSREKFSIADAQSTFKRLANNVFDRGGRNSNHPVLEAPGVLFNCLAIEDDNTRKKYLDKFVNGTDQQNGLSWMMKEIKESGAWPEATGYSIGPHRIVLELMHILDSHDPSRNIVSNNKYVLRNAFMYENYRFPDGKNVMRFGDAHRNRLNTKDLIHRVMIISENKKYGDIAKEARAMLESLYSQSGYSPTIKNEPLEWNDLYHFLWTTNLNPQKTASINYYRSINIDYAGIAMQRNLNTTEDTKEYGLMGYTGGAHYVHSHLTGIDMEIYGLGAVLGTGGGDEGASKRDSSYFRNNHRVYAGHNTVIVNGNSKGLGEGAWKNDNQLYQNTTKTVAAEPAATATAISKDFSFSAQLLDDKVNNAKQQRVFSIIRTGPKSGYYFDLFRSKSLGKNKFHDYIYHNVGDNANLKNLNGTPLALTHKKARYTSTPSLYRNKEIQFPGWHYFKDVNTSDRISQAVKATIPMTKEGKRYMHIYMPGGQSREYTSCKSLPTIEGQVGYENEETPVVSVRHFGEAWNRPFISVFEPTRDENGAVKSIENLMKGERIVGAKVVSKIAGKTITDYVISNIDTSDTYSSTKFEISFTGRFGVVRTIEHNGEVSVVLYIGEGSSLNYKTLSLDAGADNKGVLVKDNYKVKKDFHVSVKSPAEGSTFKIGQEVKMEANVLNRKGSIEKVNFRINGEFKSEVKKAPYKILWIPKKCGTYEIDVVAFDKNGQRIVSKKRNIKIKKPNTKITTTLVSPKDGAKYELGETIKLLAEAKINVGAISKVNFRVNGNYLKSEDNAPYKTGWLPKTPGTYEIDVVAFSKDGVKKISAKSKVIIKEKNRGISVNLTSPAAGAVYPLGDTVRLTADASTSTGNITKVNFRLNSKHLDRAKSYPYTINWVPKETGTFEVDVIVYSDNGTRKVSKGKKIKITAGINRPGYETKKSIASNSPKVKQNRLLVYPNPATNEFTVQFNQDNAREIAIYNLQGELLSKQQPESDKLHFTKTDLPSGGMYIVVLTDKNHNMYKQKLIIN